MRVRCKANAVADIPDAGVRERLSASIHLDGANNDLVVGMDYEVMAVERWNDGGIRVYLHTVQQAGYPYPYPLEMFEVLEPSLADAWCLGFERIHDGVSIKRISFAEWANDDQFYERLTDGDAEAVDIYRRRLATLQGRIVDVRSNS